LEQRPDALVYTSPQDECIFPRTLRLPPDAGSLIEKKTTLVYSSIRTPFSRLVERANILVFVNHCPFNREKEKDSVD
jgi:hypothetical protein